MTDPEDSKGGRSYSVITPVNDNAVNLALDIVLPRTGHERWRWETSRHITLATPGSVQDRRLDLLIRRLKETTSRLQPWDAHFDSLRTFFNTAAMRREDRPIIVWAAPDPQSWLRFQLVHADLVAGLHGFRTGRIERLAHITLGRAPLEAREEALALVRRPLDLTFRFNEIVLAENISRAVSDEDCHREKYDYRVVESFRLGG